MNILSLSSVYPNPGEPGLGLFVRSRLQEIARSEQVKVIAPIPLLDYSNPGRKLLRSRGFPWRRWDGPIEVLHPQWVCPPYGTPLNVACLYGRLLPMVRRLRKSFPFELIDAHFCYPEGIVAALLAAAFRVPFTVTLRGSELNFARYRYRRRTMRWALRRARGVIAVSGELTGFATRMGAAPEYTGMIPNGLDIDLFFPRDRERVRRKHALPAHRKLIVSAGELIEAKGHHLAIRALAGLVRRGMDAELLIVGGIARGGPGYEQELRRLAESLNLAPKVHFTGWVDRPTMAELLAVADLFCLASFTEGWPNVVHEALGCGTPVVATRVGAIPSLIPAERYGFIVPANDVEALQDALARGLRKQWDRNAISEWGRSRSWRQVAAEVIAVFRAATAAPVPQAAALKTR